MKPFLISNDVPEKHQWIFFHLVMDIFWYGILNGTGIAFISIYVARLGGTPGQLGLLAAAPAVTIILFAIPFGRWLKTKDTGREVVISSFIHRLFYLLWIPIPVLFGNADQIWIYIVITFVMNVPGTILQVGFQDFFADNVPLEWRGYIAGLRNALFALVSVITSIVAGQILIKISFPLNYQIVFLLGFLGAILSSIHIWLVWKDAPKASAITKTSPTSNKKRTLQSVFLPDIKEIFKETGRKYLVIMACLFAFHFSQFIAIPVFPIYQVNYLHLTDNWISIGNGLFYTTVFIFSTQLAKIARRLGNKRVIALGASMYCLYPLILANSHSVGIFLTAAAVGGIAWALAGGVVYNYILDNMPEGNRSPYLAIYNLILNAAILLGSIIGPEISDLVGITTALYIFAAVRFISGLIIFRWG